MFGKNKIDMDVIEIDSIKKQEENVVYFKSISVSKLESFQNIITELQNTNNEITAKEEEILTMINSLKDSLNKLSEVKLLNQNVINKFEALIS